MKAISNMSFFFCKPLETITTARDVLTKLVHFCKIMTFLGEMFVVFAQTVLQQC